MSRCSMTWCIAHRFETGRVDHATGSQFWTPGGAGRFARLSSYSPQSQDYNRPVSLYLGLFKVIFYFPNGKSTMTGESIVDIFYFLGTP